MNKPRFEGYDVIAESGDFLLVDAPAHALYPRRWSSYQVLAQLTVVCGEWHVGFITWYFYLMKDIEAVAAAIGMFMGIPVLEEDRILTLIKIKENETYE